VSACRGEWVIGMRATGSGVAESKVSPGGPWHADVDAFAAAQFVTGAYLRPVNPGHGHVVRRWVYDYDQRHPEAPAPLHPLQLVELPRGNDFLDASSRRVVAVMECSADTCSRAAVTCSGDPINPPRGNRPDVAGADYPDCPPSPISPTRPERAKFSKRSAETATLSAGLVVRAATSRARVA
jgi:hypothetical protein